MQPRQIVRAASFEPAALKVIFKAFDDAWSELAPKIRAEPCSVELARMDLAAIVLGLANTDPITPDGLKKLAIAVFRAKRRI